MSAHRSARRRPRGIAVGIVASLVVAAGVTTMPTAAFAVGEPSAPTNVVATVGHSSFAEISWHRPASEGDSPITGYLIRTSPSDPGTEVANIADYGDHLEAQHVVEYGVTYEFALAAVNTQGTGPWSESAAPVTPRPVVSINNATTAEGNSGTHAVSFTVRLDYPSALPVSLHYATTKAGAGTSFVPTAGTLTFTPGQSVKTLNVSVKGDVRYETNEKVTMRLSAVSGATFGKKAGIATITNDDAIPTLSVANASIAEGGAGTSKKVTLAVTLSAPSGVMTKVRWATSNGTATAGSDYRKDSGRLRIGAGKTSDVIVITILGDATVEPGETILVDLSSPVGATIADGHGVVTIGNDD